MLWFQLKVQEKLDKNNFPGELFFGKKCSKLVEVEKIGKEK